MIHLVQLSIFFISIHSLRMEGDKFRMLLETLPDISIHSLRMEGDVKAIEDKRKEIISIHSLRMEGDKLGTVTVKKAKNFNPLPPHGGRRGMQRKYSLQNHFNPLPPHGGRHAEEAHNELVKEFQSTPSAWRETCSKHLTCITLSLFQSTPSAWRETAKLHRKAFFISPILVQSCKKGCKRLHSAPEKMVFFEKREKNLVRNLQHLSVRL